MELEWGDVSSTEKKSLRTMSVHRKLFGIEVYVLDAVGTQMTEWTQSVGSNRLKNYI